jgi:hypothetical protein
MKTLTTIRILISLLAVNAGVLWGAPTAANPTSVTLPAPTPYAVVSRDAHSRVWERTVYERGPSGQAIASKHRYVELATGLNFWDSTAKQWQESQELIESFPGGAIARQGQHQVIFANNLATMGAIDMQTPDGKRLRSHVLGLSYFDTASGQSVLIAEVKDSQGQLYPPNVVIYPDAFTDFKADVRYTYTRAGFEQDIILHERPPGPEAYGLNPATTRLQVLTEFLNPPQPGKKPGALKTRQGDALDEDLDFGVMKMGHGKAFSLERGDGDIPVSKQWLKLGGRDFLVEEVAVPDLEEEIQALPSAEGASLNPAAGSVRHMVSKQRRLPAMPLVRAGTNEMQLARLSLPSQGLVLDYVTMTAQTNYTFQGDSTYYISGIVYLYGTNTFEGGAVIKYTNGAAIYLVPSAPGYGLNWQASAYRPVVFTSMNDNSVGESISSSTGNPTNDYFANPALNITGSTTTISYFRIAYARQAISLMGGPPNFYHGQIVNCNNGITTSGANTIFLRNILFGNVCTNFNNLLHGIFDVQNSTFSGSSYLSTIQNQPYQSSGVTLTNCLLVNVTNLQNTYTNIGSYWVDGGYNGFYNTPMFGSATVSSPFLPFQQVGAGNYYLTNGCSFLNAGTNNIDAILLASLKQKTTFPPVVYSNLTISVDTNFIPQVQRDTNSSPSLGYHYDPIDYLVDLCSITNATLTMTNGTAIATYNEAGFRLQDCSKIISTGSPDSPNWFVRYSSVQEQPISLNGTYGGGIAVLPSYTSVMPSAQYRFTKFACPAGGGIHLYDYVASSYSNLLVQDCEFWSGANTLGGTDGAVLTLKNNLFVRSVINASGNGSLSLSNTLAWGVSSVQLNPLSTNIWYAFNNDFDSCNITTSTLTNGCNAYLNCSGRLYPTNAYDVVSNATLACQTGPLGNYYQPTNSPLINAGSTTADKVGLYHYTTTTNEVKETNSPVDIGYHYVALNPQLSTINPVDSNGDGIPDYLEDANGNGLVDSGETAWMLLPPVITTQPQSQTVTAGNGATFNVAATGTSPLYYQWRKSGSTLTDGDNISGANSNILTLTSLTPWDAGIYTVMVSNAAGSVTSLYAVLRVWTPSGVFAWGGDGGYGFGNTNVPPGLTNVVGIAAGGYHS